MVLELSVPGILFHGIFLLPEASRGPEKGSVSAQKALQESETETRELLGGTEENRVSQLGVIDLPSRQIN